MKRNPQDIVTIKKLLNQKFSIKQIAKKTGLGPVLIRNIRDENKRNLFLKYPFN